MPNRNYQHGRQFEYRVRDFFRKRYYYVVRSAKSAFPDLLVVSPDGFSYFIECKSTKNEVTNPITLLSNDERNKALSMIIMYKRPFYLFYRVGRIMRFVELYNDNGLRCSLEMNMSRWS